MIKFQLIITHFIGFFMVNCSWWSGGIFFKCKFLTHFFSLIVLFYLFLEYFLEKLQEKVAYLWARLECILPNYTCDLINSVNYLFLQIGLDEFT